MCVGSGGRNYVRGWGLRVRKTIAIVLRVRACIHISTCGFFFLLCSLLLSFFLSFVFTFFFSFERYADVAIDAGESANGYAVQVKTSLETARLRCPRKPRRSIQTCVSISATPSAGNPATWTRAVRTASEGPQSRRERPGEAHPRHAAVWKAGERTDGQTRVYNVVSRPRYI